ncbi:MAG: glycosyltransferase [bacterium]
MIPPYTLIIPYYKTPEITRLALRSIRRFCRAEHEIIVIDNAPDSPESAMLQEFPEIRRIENRSGLTGSPANFEAIDIGVKEARHDLLGLLHSDTIFLREGWDEEQFGYMEKHDLAVLGTFEREASPHRPLHRKIRDIFFDFVHSNRPQRGSRKKLMLFFLLTRASVLRELNFSFMKSGHLLPIHLESVQNGLETLSCLEISRFMWHTSNVTSLLTGQMDDPKMAKNFRKKREMLLQDNVIRELL